MKRLLSIVAAIASMIATGCAVGADDEAHRLGLTIEAEPVSEPNLDSPGSDVRTVALSVYLVRDNLLVHVTREGAPGRPDVEAAVAATVAGPTAAEARSGIWSAVPPGTSVRGAQIRDGVAMIDLSSRFATIGGTDELLAVAQVVRTLTAIPEVDAVVFLLEGVAIAVPRADGVLVSGPVTAQDYIELTGR